MSNARELSKLVSNRVNPVLTTDKAYACLAWVYFDGANYPINTTEVEFLGGGNVSSITSTDAAYIRINFATNLPHSEYSVVGSGSENATADVVVRDSGSYLKENSGFTISVLHGGSYSNSDKVNLIVIG